MQPWSGKMSLKESNFLRKETISSFRAAACDVTLKFINNLIFCWKVMTKQANFDFELNTN